jgi:nicotinate phosphoribosyltransferase
VSSSERIPAIPTGLLLTDLYQLNMMQAYLDSGMTGTAVFEFFVRKLPAQRNFLLSAGLAQVMRFLQEGRFEPAELEWLRSSGRFSDSFVDYLADFRFAGDVHAIPEGTAVFPNEPVLRVTAPLPVAQLLETRLINLLHTSILVASKAARMVLAAPDKRLVDFGLRRAHGSEAGLLAAHAAYMAGFAGTATVPAAPLWDIPIMGTMAHSFVEAHEDESRAFLDFARSRPQEVVLLIDTYDVRRAARTVVDIAPMLEREGITVKGVRIDSGDLAQLARDVREILDEGGLPHVSVLVSGGLDEWKLRDFTDAGVPIDGYGIGTALTTSEDAPALDCAYKLQEYDGRMTRKLSSGKATWPGRKQVWRTYGSDGSIAGDVISLEDDDQSGTPLVEKVMEDGRPTGEAPTLAAARERAAAQLAALPPRLRGLEPAEAYPVSVSDLLRRTADAVARDIGRRGHRDEVPAK